jgi:hypothetical protein
MHRRGRKYQTFGFGRHSDNHHVEEAGRYWMGDDVEGETSKQRILAGASQKHSLLGILIGDGEIGLGLERWLCSQWISSAVRASCGSWT